MPRDPRSFSDLVNVFIDLIKEILPVLIGLAVLVFIWGLARFIFRIGGDEKAVADGKKLITWGLIALFILFSFLGIITFFRKEVGFGGETIVPRLPTK